jgi:protein-S-isoprenylcysteine O-methyltransferase Ste14
MLIALVGLMGFAIAMVDEWLDARLPHPSPDRKRPAAMYLAVALLGAIMVLPFLVLELLTSDGYRAPIRAGLALLVVGLCTLAWWLLRLRGRSEPPRALTSLGRVAVLLATALGFLTALPHVRSAAGVL